MPQRTKIIATLGPASDELYLLERMLQAGMDVARLNFSHGSYKHHEKIITNVRTAAKKTGYNVAILQDLQGPKIRTGVVPEEGIRVKRNERVTFTTTLKPKKNEIPLQYKNLPKEVKRGDIILIDDGLIELQVLSKNNTTIYAKAINAGTIKSNKGINVP
ncbi:MAG: pyruvate kinase, partial [uncultured bacterium]